MRDIVFKDLWYDAGMQLVNEVEKLYETDHGWLVKIHGTNIKLDVTVEYYPAFNDERLTKLMNIVAAIPRKC